MIKKILKILGVILIIIIIAVGIGYYLLKDQVAVMTAVLDEDKETLAYYIDEKGFNPNDLYGWFNLYHLYLMNKKSESDKDFIEFMLQKGIKTEYNKNRKSTALTYSIAIDRSDLVELFIEYGDDINRIGYNGSYPLGTSLALFNCEVAKILVDNGATLKEGKNKELFEERLEECKSNNWVSTNKIKIEK